MLISIGAVIKKRRKELGLTQSRLSAIAEVSSTTLREIELGKVNPGVDVVSRILDILGMELRVVVKNIEEVDHGAS
ncbi:helix-turn-helix domain-containing protein [Pedobacter ghigonis]|uniref:helix-turn-helix domain-containing protein n=1 Tax=Pedobacter ghigonis TaxID=2730403 RepID=UPI00158B7E3F|nr:helix-turn-helix domain-containing protein [Pedobacter ghigonis]